MPVQPTPGNGISPRAIDKVKGWNAVPDEGIDHFAGLTKSGLDTANNPVLSDIAAGSITTTGATITWTTADESPAGQVDYVPAAGGVPAVVSEAGGPMSEHSVPLTGLITGTTYNYAIIQTSAAGNQASSTSSFTTA